MAKKKRFSEEDYQRFLDKASAGPLATQEAAIAPDEGDAPSDAAATGKGKKRRGVSETPILTSIEKASIFVEASDRHLTIAFSGARLFTLNELFAIQQYRKYIVFAYKKAWHAKTREALLLLGRKKPRFDGPCKITYFRQGSRRVDNDSLAVMFKYILDALKDDPERDGTPGWKGVFRDDDPTVAIDDRKIQRPGGHLVAIRVDLLEQPPEGTDDPCSSLFATPPDKLDPPAVEPVKRKGKPKSATTEKPVTCDERGHPNRGSATSHPTQNKAKTATRSRSVPAKKA